MRLFAELPSEYQDLGEWLALTLLPELTTKVIAIGLPRDLAEVVAKEAVHAVVGKITRGAQVYAAAAQASRRGSKPS